MVVERFRADYKIVLDWVLLFVRFEQCLKCKNINVGNWLAGMSDLWTVGEIVEATGGVCSSGEAGYDIAIGSVSIDSRTIEDGGLYVAIQGVSQDGHLYVGASFAKGAHAALVKRGYKPEDGVVSKGGVLIFVDDTLQAMEDLGRAARNRTKGKIIAVTGSAGKTGTKEALREMCEALGKTHASVKSFNNHWGVPLSLARMPRDCEFGIFEVGMNHAGEISPLSKMIRPDIALITTVAPVHIGHFANEEEIADAKAEIFDGLGGQSGAAVLPADNRHYERLCSAARGAGVSRIVGFGAADGAELRLIDGQFGSESSTIIAEIFGQRLEIDISIPGEHIAINLIGALGCVALAGGDVRKAADVLSDLTVPEGRGVRHILSVGEGTYTLIDESYNANPASMNIALKNLSSLQGDAYCRRIAVLGDMLELGVGSEGYHREISAVIDGLDVNLVFASGPMMAHMFAELPKVQQGAYSDISKGLIDPLRGVIRPGDVVMIKGSFGSEMGLIVKALCEQ